MEITVNFRNILSELKSKKFKLCFVNSRFGLIRSLCIEDDQNNLYQMEVYRQGSYLDRLIKDGIVVNFHQVETFKSKNIGEWEKEIWGASEVEAFIKEQSQYW